MSKESDEAARLAGWSFKDGEAPFEHHLPPPIDEKLGTNGIAPTDAKRIA